MDQSENIAPWDRQPYETQTTWAMFQAYLEQDPPRSILTACRNWRARKGPLQAAKAAKIKAAPGSFRNIAAGKNHRGDPLPGGLTWSKRATAWDDHIADLERQKWVERRLALREKEWGLGEKLLEKATQMLMFPVMAQEAADGRTVIMPAGWNFRDIPPILAQASKLARLAAGMSTENISLDWRDEARKAGFDPDAIYRKLVDEYKSALGGSNEAGSMAGSPQDPGSGPE